EPEPPQPTQRPRLLGSTVPRTLAVAAGSVPAERLVCGHELPIRQWIPIHRGRIAGCTEPPHRRSPTQSFSKLMPTVAYLTNQFPSPVEPYVVEEIRELRRRGITVIPCSARYNPTALDSELKALAAETLHLQPLRLQLLIYAALLCFVKLPTLEEFYRRALFQGSEPLRQRLRALLHTWLGVYYALLLEKSRVEHIHVHHGYFASWIAMVAARFLEIEFSMTLHGSDLLLHAAYLDAKLKHCMFCVTISEFNRQHLLQSHPTIPPDKI